MKFVCRELSKIRHSLWKRLLKDMPTQSLSWLFSEGAHQNSEKIPGLEHFSAEVYGRKAGHLSSVVVPDASAAKILTWPTST